MQNKSIRISNKIEELTIIFNEIEQICNRRKISKEIQLKIQLIAEELISNTIFHGYIDQKEHHITIEIALENDKINVSIIDDGIAFNPLLADNPDINTSIENREIGGLGIFLIKSFADSIEYKREKNLNILQFSKNLD